ncbi:MAG: hydantoinase/oxoprolinase family protein [Bacillota bacterium]
MGKYKIIGWDIGGANIKATKIVYNQKNNKIESVLSISKYFAMWDKNQNPLEVIAEIYQNFNEADYFAITMTAELADRFSTKIEGINYIIDLFKDNFADKKLYFYNNQAKFLRVEELENNIEKSISLAAANWAASASFAAEFKKDFILFDMGSSTIDLIPVRNNKIAALGFTDVERLKQGELIYHGFLRSNLSNLSKEIPYQGQLVAVINEYFATTADLHLLKNIINSAEYTVEPADSGQKSKEAAAARIARMISLDLNSISESQLNLIVDYIYNQEISLIYNKLLQLYSRDYLNLQIPLLINSEAAYFKDDLKMRSDFKFLELSNLIPVLTNNILTTTSAASLLLKKIIGKDLVELMGLNNE